VKIKHEEINTCVLISRQNKRNIKHLVSLFHLYICQFPCSESRERNNYNTLTLTLKLNNCHNCSALLCLVVLPHGLLPWMNIIRAFIDAYSCIGVIKLGFWIWIQDQLSVFFCSRPSKEISNTFTWAKKNAASSWLFLLWQWMQNKTMQ